jgi:hypothetical protein
VMDNRRLVMPCNEHCRVAEGTTIRSCQTRSYRCLACVPRDDSLRYPAGISEAWTPRQRSFGARTHGGNLRVVFRVQSSKVEGGGARVAGALGTMVPTTMAMFALLNPTIECSIQCC